MNNPYNSVASRANTFWQQESMVLSHAHICIATLEAATILRLLKMSEIPADSLKM